MYEINSSQNLLRNMFVINGLKTAKGNGFLIQKYFLEKSSEKAQGKDPGLVAVLSLIILGVGVFYN